MFDVVIIGAGPAGLSAAVKCAENGLRVTIIDEFIKPGGRLLGQLHEEPNGTWWNGITEAQKLYNEAIKQGVQINCGTSVYNLNKTETHWTIYTNESIIKTKTLLLATGAAETATPIPGWTLPGVMSIGAAQVMTNVHRVKVGNKGIIIGVNVLATAIGRELQLAGITVSEMVLPSLHTLSKNSGNPRKVMESLLHVSHLAPSAVIRYGSKLMKNSFFQNIGVNFYPKQGVKMWDIPIHLRKAATHIIGKDKVEAVGLVTIDSNGTPISGTEREVSVDFVCIAGGLYPLAELASIAGCPFYYIAELGGHVPLHNERMETPLEGLFVAGNITGIESAKVAMTQGTVAGLSIASYLSKTDGNVEKELNKAIQSVKETRDRALIQFHPEIKEGRQKLQQIWSDTMDCKRTLTL